MQELELFPLTMDFLGGLALFLFGMEQMTDAPDTLTGTQDAETMMRVGRQRDPIGAP